MAPLPPPPRADSRCPLPSLAHLRGSDWANVYEPSDDTYLLLDNAAYHRSKEVRNHLL